MEVINDDRQVRMALLRETGYNVEVAQKCWDFVYGKKQEPVSNRLEDGVYLIDTKGNAVRYDAEDTEIAGDIAKIGIVQGNRSIAISLYDMDKYEITLAAKEGKKDHKSCKDRYMNAVQDWDGKHNTELLKRIGLNPVIKLKDNEYIPSLAELYLICLNQKTINSAMNFVGGQELIGWYWSSTEYSSTYTWVLYFTDGRASLITKTTDTSRIRPVSAFY